MKKSIFAGILFALLFICPVKVSAESGFELKAESTVYQVEDVIQVTVAGEEMENVYGYELTLQYGDYLTCTGIQDGNELNGGIGTGYESDGYVYYAYTLIGENAEGMDGSQTLCSLLFRADAAGQTQVVLREVKVITADYQEIIYSDLNETLTLTIQEKTEGSAGVSSGDEEDPWDAVLDQISSGETELAMPEGYASIPNRVMQALDSDKAYTLTFSDGTVVIIPANEAADDDTEWYGPEWFREHYGTASAEESGTASADGSAAATEGAQTGDSMETALMVFGLIAAAAAAGLCVIAVCRKREQR